MDFSVRKQVLGLSSHTATLIFAGEILRSYAYLLKYLDPCCLVRELYVRQGIYLASKALICIEGVLLTITY